jgi:phosphoketolase
VSFSDCADALGATVESACSMSTLRAMVRGGRRLKSSIAGIRRDIHHHRASHFRLSSGPWLIRRLTYSRTNHTGPHVRGFKEHGTTTTPFDMVMLNGLDRLHLVMGSIDRLDGLPARAARVLAADGRCPPHGPAVHPRTREDDARIAGWT